jgi:hypothetical protein
VISEKLNRSKFSFNLSLEVRLKPVQPNLKNFSVSGGEPNVPKPAKPGTGTQRKLACGTCALLSIFCAHKVQIQLRAETGAVKIFITDCQRPVKENSLLAIRNRAITAIGYRIQGFAILKHAGAPRVNVFKPKRLLLKG